ncbi:hypothetical protein PRZ48_004079 [Zasmidium cellare]|uniref:U6 small nuclear RNA (adenine-(43)-N(6))-methyltransferase n=1 Tax=Zasmidium cellare TaxID=395010 RepID=A0ABR0EXM8_ZASCE|nr:hypothetical protein PRZ48_004079 [Zasmidium cellare]
MKQIPYYSRDVDFDDLAKHDPEFAAISQKGKRDGFINFQDPEIVQQLTKSLLKKDFNLHISLPSDRLCPPIPVRWNYVRWIQELLDTTSEDYRETFDSERRVTGLDIGVGASCVYGLLACSSRETWRMLGTDVDGYSLRCARRNVEINDLQDRIRLHQTQPDGPLLPLDIDGLDFVMTNPPFYTDHAEFLASYNTSSGSSPHPNTTGSENEMLTPGGDVGFVSRIVTESLQLRQKVKWYTAMLSKLSSLQQIVALLKGHGIGNFAVTSLHPGHRTKRYAVAWSFGDLRARNDVARHGELVLGVLPLRSAWTVEVSGRNKRQVGVKVRSVMEALEGVRWDWNGVQDAGVLECWGNVWGRKARRKKGREGGGDEGEGPVKMAVRVWCRDQEVEVRWLRGQDYTLYESFCGMMKRSMKEGE